LQLTEAIEDFLLEGEGQLGWAKGTVENYRWHLTQWATWLRDQQAEDLTRLELRAVKRLLNQWGVAMRERWQDSTARSAKIAVRSFLKWLKKDGCLEADLAGLIKVPVATQRICRTMAPNEVTALVAACDDLPAQGLTLANAQLVCLRNKAIITLLFDSLLRAHELCKLTVADLDLPHQSLKVIGTGGNERRAFFGRETTEHLQTWLAARGPVAAAGVQAVFVSVGGNTPGHPLKPRGLRLILKRIGDRIGIPDVSPHAFRRGGATAAIANGAPSRAVQQFGGWSNLEMVERYTQALNAGDLYQRYCPMDHLPPAPGQPVAAASTAAVVGGQSEASANGQPPKTAAPTRRVRPRLARKPEH
jgi:integrase/recombinase XerC